MSTYIVESNGTLTFPEDANGNRVPDYSYAGYDFLGRDGLPTLGTEYSVQATVAALNANNTDAAALSNTNAIQAAIDAVEALPLNDDGFRGAVDFTDSSGTFYIDDETAITVEASGVVIHAEGLTFINKGSTGSPNEQIVFGPDPDASVVDKWDYYGVGRDGSTYNITDSAVSVGATSFTLDDVSALAKGDDIIISHEPTAAWVSAVDDGGFTPNVATADEWPLVETYYAGPDFTGGPVNIRYWRKVTAVDADSKVVTIDAPIMYRLNKTLVQSIVYKYTQSYITNVGWVGGTLDLSEFWNDDAQHNTNPGDAPRQSSKGDGLVFQNVAHGFVKDLVARNYRVSGIKMEYSRNVSVINCQSINPHSVIESAKMYGFNCDGGQMIFYEGCYSAYNRHNYIVNGWGSDSGNVYYNCTSDNNYGQAEYGHQKGSHGALFDSCVFEQTGSPAYNATGNVFRGMQLWLGNHELNSRGQGWSSFNCVAYKCQNDALDDNQYFLIQVQDTGPNWEFGTIGHASSTHHSYPSDTIVTGTFDGDAGQGVSGGYSGTLPTSLYEQQLSQRLNAVPNNQAKGMTSSKSRGAIAGGARFL